MTDQQTWQDLFEEADQPQTPLQEAMTNAERPEPTEFEFIVGKLADAQADPAWYNIAAIVDQLRREHVQLVGDLNATQAALRQQFEAYAQMQGALTTARHTLEAINDGGMTHSEIKQAASGALRIIDEGGQG